MTLEKWFDQEDIIKVNAAVRDVFDKGYGEVEAPLILKSGKKMMTRSSGAPLIWEGHKYFVGIGVDITEQKRVEYELKQRENYNHTILDTTQDGFWVVDFKGQITDVNQAYCQMTGYTKTELLGMKIGNLDVLEKPQETAMRINRIIKNGSDLFETQHKKKDGSLLNIEISATFADRDAGIFAFCRNITERKRAEAQLRQSMNDLLESEEKFKYVFDNSAVGKSITLPSGEIHVNKAFCEMLGYSSEELTEKKWQEISHPDGIEKAQNELNSVRGAIAYAKYYH
jgi:PAS domain S-box-containing protein